jgi:5'-3' exonuclease, N-terminal resolvase-like domain
MMIHLIDGTYELFRHYYGLRRLPSKGLPFGAVAGVLGTVIQMLEEGATHIGVATDHIIESFRNELWPGYKTGLGIEPALHAQFVPLEKALVAMGVATWPMVELEADDALASAANNCGAGPRGRKGLHLDSGQGPRPVRALCAGRSQERADSRRRGRAREVRCRAVAHRRLPRARRRRSGRLSWDSENRAKTAARLITRYGAIEQVPPHVLGNHLERALLFKKLATLRTDAPLFTDVEALRWRGATDAFARAAEQIGAPGQITRIAKLTPTV